MYCTCSENRKLIIFVRPSDASAGAETIFVTNMAARYECHAS